MLWAVVNCCELWVVVSCCKLYCELLWVVVSCCELLWVVVSFCELLWVIVSCCELLWVVVNCCELLWAVVSCCGLWVVVSCCELLWVLTSCCELLWVLVRVVVSCCELLWVLWVVVSCCELLWVVWSFCELGELLSEVVVSSCDPFLWVLCRESVWVRKQSVVFAVFWTQINCVLCADSKKMQAYFQIKNERVKYFFERLCKMSALGGKTKLLNLISEKKKILQKTHPKTPLQVCIFKKALDFLWRIFMVSPLFREN